MRHEGEPSVEEILQSIKKVIARDNREAQQAERRRRERAGIVLTPGKPADENGDKVDEVVEASGEAHREGLTTESSAQAMRESLAALAMIAKPGAAPQIVRSGET